MPETVATASVSGKIVTVTRGDQENVVWTSEPGAKLGDVLTSLMLDGAVLARFHESLETEITMCDIGTCNITAEVLLALEKIVESVQLRHIHFSDCEMDPSAIPAFTRLLSARSDTFNMLLFTNSPSMTHPPAAFAAIISSISNFHLIHLDVGDAVSSASIPDAKRLFDAAADSASLSFLSARVLRLELVDYVLGVMIPKARSLEHVVIEPTDVSLDTVPKQEAALAGTMKKLGLATSQRDDTAFVDAASCIMLDGKYHLLSPGRSANREITKRRLETCFLLKSIGQRFRTATTPTTYLQEKAGSRK